MSTTRTEPGGSRTKRRTRRSRSSRDLPSGELATGCRLKRPRAARSNLWDARPPVADVTAPLRRPRSDWTGYAPLDAGAGERFGAALSDIGEGLRRWRA